MIFFELKKLTEVQIHSLGWTQYLSLVDPPDDCEEVAGKSLVTQNKGWGPAEWTKLPMAAPLTSCLPAKSHTALVL